MGRIALLALFYSVQLGASYAQGILSEPLRSETGPAIAVESDHVAVNGVVYALYGIDAPLRVQWCLTQSERFGCGIQAFHTLQNILETGPVACEQVRDPHLRRRVLRFGTCKIGELDVAAEMVRRGMAMAFVAQSDQYASLQEQAARDNVGLWAADEFMPPWVWEETHFDER